MPGVWRYLAAWVIASAVVVAALAVALDSGEPRPADLTLAAERAACRFDSDSERPATSRIILSYRPSLSGEDMAKVLDIARRLPAVTVSIAEDAPGSEAIAADNGQERLGCPRVDAQAARAIVLFALSSELER
jgi:hypothetical protein